MTKQELVERMQQGQAWVPGKRVKIDFGGSEGAIMLDGAAGQLDGMTAFMMGKLKVEGDMGNAMQLQGVLAKLRS